MKYVARGVGFIVFILVHLIGKWLDEGLEYWEQRYSK